LSLGKRVIFEMRQPILAVLWFLVFGGALPAQEPVELPGGALTLEQCVAFASKNYPAIRASAAEVSAAISGIDLARTTYLPRADLLMQFNRATRNNVFGLILPNSVIPAISGPVQDVSTSQSTFGSAAGVLFSWEPFDFGLRSANVRVAEAIEARARAGQAVAEYEVSLAAINAYLDAVANQRAVEAAAATVERMQVFAGTARVLVESELRPGADHSRAIAELARASNEQIRAEQEAAAALATLAEWMGAAGQPIQIEPRALLAEPPPEPSAAAALETHPLAEAQQAEIDIVRARRLSAAKEWRPTVALQSAAYGRGTGARMDGSFQGGAHGLAPSEGNWAVGFTMRFNVFDYKQSRVREQIEAHHEEARQAERDRVLQELRGHQARAQIAVNAARRIAENTPRELEAARTLEAQAQSRYRAGLGAVVEVAEAQRLLRQAEVENALARLGVWRALFALAAAQGEIDRLLARSSQ
jgi:outer membrane protein TolC